MRTILFFDLPTLTNKNLKDYRKFRKGIIKLGFYMIQESVYVKISIDSQLMDSTISKIKDILPPDGNVMVLNVTEKQFNSIIFLLGKSNSPVIDTDDRVIVL